MRVMLDNGISSHSHFAEPATHTWARGAESSLGQTQVSGFIRKKLHVDKHYQSQIDALFTIGRLIREKRLKAYTYDELRVEQWKAYIGCTEFDALQDCLIQDCPSAICRSHFQQGDAFEFMAKGGKANRKEGLPLGLTQIRFMEWLHSLSDASIQSLVSLRTGLSLSEFERTSFRNLRQFTLLCEITRSTENYPDMFHIWTAQRNEIEVFLTLEKRLVNIAGRIHRVAQQVRAYPTKVLNPLQLLSLLGIAVCDPVPIEAERFYPMFGSSVPL